MEFAWLDYFQHHHRCNCSLDCQYKKLKTLQSMYEEKYWYWYQILVLRFLSHVITWECRIACKFYFGVDVWCLHAPCFYEQLYCNNITMNDENNIKHQHQHEHQHWLKRNHCLDLDHHHEAETSNTMLKMNDKWHHLKTTKFSYVSMLHANVCCKLTVHKTDHGHPTFTVM